MPAIATEPAVDELRRRARRRLVGAIVLALAAAVIVPMLLESDPKPLGEDVSVRIPPIDEGRFVNRLSLGAADAKPGEPRADAATDPASTRSRSADGKVATESKPGAPAAPAVPAPGVATPPGSAARSSAVPDAPKASLSPSASAPSPAAADSSSQATASQPRSSPTAPDGSAGAAKPIDAKPGSYAVQLAAFADDKGANALASRLKKSGYSAYTEPLPTSRGTLWRVRVGPFPTRDAADAARSKLKGDGQNGIVTAAR